jgi:hypothetical protein
LRFLLACESTSHRRSAARARHQQMNVYACNPLPAFARDEGSLARQKVKMSWHVGCCITSSSDFMPASLSSFIWARSARASYDSSALRHASAIVQQHCTPVALCYVRGGAAGAALVITRIRGRRKQTSSRQFFIAPLLHFRRIVRMQTPFQTSDWAIHERDPIARALSLPANFLRRRFSSTIARL